MHISVNKAVDDLGAKAVPVVKGKMLHTHLGANAFGILNIVQTAAFAIHYGQANILVIKKLHGDAGAGVTLLLHEQCCYAGVYAATHGD